MRKLAARAGLLINGGSALVLMGAQWLYLWMFPWYSTFRDNPEWGHNYMISLAFLSVGIACFSRRLLSDFLAVLAALLALLAAMSLAPVDEGMFIGAVLFLFILLDMLAEWKKPYSRIFLSGRGAAFSAWLEKYLICFAFLFLAGIALVYFTISLPGGTHDNDIDTIMFDALLIPFSALLILDRLGIDRHKDAFKQAAFFWGLLTMVAILLLMTDQPETWPLLGVCIAVTLIGAAVAWINGRGKSLS